MGLIENYLIHFLILMSLYPKINIGSVHTLKESYQEMVQIFHYFLVLLKTLQHGPQLETMLDLVKYLQLIIKLKCNPQYPSVPIANQNPATQYVPPTNTTSFRTFQDLCTGQYFNITDPNNYTMTNSFNYTNNDVWYLEVLDNSSQPKTFVLEKFQIVLKPQLII